LEQSRNKEFGGTGLGLAVVYAIVIAHKGSIEYSNPNQNSVFSIKLPIEKDHI
jgi:two-component system sensor histidine kinase AdeS